MISFKFYKTWLSYNIRFRSRYWVCNACIAYHQHRILGTAFLKHYQTSKLYFLLYLFEQKKKLIFLNFLTNALLGRSPIDTTIGTSGGLWPRASYVPDRCFIVGMLTCLLLIMHGFATVLECHISFTVGWYISAKFWLFRKQKWHTIYGWIPTTNSILHQIIYIDNILECFGICSDLYFICVYYYLVHVYAIMACGKGRERLGAQKDNAILVKARHRHSRILLHSIVCFHR